MKLNPMDLGVCGVKQMLYAGNVSFNTDDVDEGVVLCKLPDNTIVTGAVCVVKTAFNAATTNVLTLGTKVGTTVDDDALMAASDITEGTAGAYKKDLWVDCSSATEIVAKFTETGTAATAGSAEFFLEVVRRPE